MEYRRHRLDSRVASVLGRLSESSRPEAAQQLVDRLSSFIDTVLDCPTGAELTEVLAPVQWVLDRADDGGLPLTEAGYLKPADVRELASLLPSMADWIFPVNREINSQPVLVFRDGLQRRGLLHRYKGTLRLRPAVRPLVQDAAALWAHLADHLVPSDPAFDTDCTVVVLIHAVSSERAVSSFAVADLMNLLGWGHAGGLPVTHSDAQWVINDVREFLAGFGPLGGTRHEPLPGPAARCLVRDALVEYTVDL